MSGILLIAVSAAFSYLFTALMQKIMIPQGKFDLSDNNSGAQFLFGGVPFVLSTAAVSAVIVGINMAAGFGNPIVSYSGILSFMNTVIWSGIAAALMFAAIGFFDDNLKIKNNSISGINNITMSSLQLVAAAAYLFLIFFSYGRTPCVYIPFIGNIYSSLLFWISGLAVIFGSINTYRLNENKDKLLVYIGIICFVSVCIMGYIKKSSGCMILASAAAGGLSAFCIFKKKFPAAVPGRAGMMFSSALLLRCVYILDCPLMMLLFYAVYIIEGIHALLFRGKSLYGRMISSGLDEKNVNLIYILLTVVFCTAGIIMIKLG